MQKPRTKCQVYTRVMGYYRPVSHFNIGKKSEYAERTYFKERIPGDHGDAKTSTTTSVWIRNQRLETVSHTA